MQALHPKIAASICDGYRSAAYDPRLTNLATEPTATHRLNHASESPSSLTNAPTPQETSPPEIELPSEHPFGLPAEAPTEFPQEAPIEPQPEPPIEPATEPPITPPEIAPESTC